MVTFYSASAIVGRTVTGQYVYQLDGYSRTKEIPNGKRIHSPTFWVGDCCWCITCYPNGANPSCPDYVSVFLNLVDAITKPVKVRPRFSLLDKAGKPVPGHSRDPKLPEYFVVGAEHGFSDFIKRKFLEESEHLVDDCLRIRCDFSVPASIRTEDRAPPLSDLQQHLRNLLVAKQGTDITFQVGGAMFSAHKCVLAARSPVFRAELFGVMREGTTTGDFIRVDDMLVHVFEALLHFIYTDSLPEMTGIENSTMVEHLLVAADRYGMQRLKLICEEKLSRDVDENTVAKMLRLAVRHRCHKLKENCIEFLKDPPSLDVIMATDDDLFEFVAAL